MYTEVAKFIAFIAGIAILIFLAMRLNEHGVSIAHLFATAAAFAGLVMVCSPQKWKITIFSIVFFFVAVFTGFPQYIKAREIREAALSVAETIEQETIDAATAETLDEIKVRAVNVPSSSEMAPIINWVNQSRERSAAILLDYSNSFLPGFEDPFSPENLYDIASIHKSKEEIIQILNSIPSYRERTKNHFDGLVQEFKELDVSEDLKISALIRLKDLMNSNIATYNEFFSIQENVLRTRLAQLAVMEDAYGTYEFDENGQLYFTYDHHVEQFNELMTSFNNYALLEQDWREKMLANNLRIAEEIKGRFNR